MHNAAVVLGSVLLSTGAAFAVVTLAAPKPRDEPGPAADVHAELGRLAEQNRQLQQKLDAMQQQLVAAGTQRVAVPTDAQVGAAVAAYLERHGAAPQPAGAEDAAEPAAQVDVGQMFLQIQGQGWSTDELWAQAREAGVLDDLVKRFEEQARANPNLAEAQVDAGMAYIRKLTEGGASQSEQGVLAMKADAAFDRALDIDERHWGARFSKAVSYTYWPPVWGKGQEAVKHFETLVQQQEEGQPQPQFATTYELLGNMYVQQGNEEKARAVWQRGATLFPNNASLAEKLK